MICIRKGYNMNLERELEVAKACAVEAGRAIMDIYENATEAELDI